MVSWEAKELPRSAAWLPSQHDQQPVPRQLDGPTRTRQCIVEIGPAPVTVAKVPCCSSCLTVLRAAVSAPGFSCCRVLFILRRRQRPSEPARHAATTSWQKGSGGVCPFPLPFSSACAGVCAAGAPRYRYAETAAERRELPCCVSWRVTSCTLVAAACTHRVAAFRSSSNAMCLLQVTSYEH